jgi:hypothetical protein
MSARPGIRPAGEPSTVRPAASRWRGNTSGSDNRSLSCRSPGTTGGGGGGLPRRAALASAFSRRARSAVVSARSTQTRGRAGPLTTSRSGLMRNSIRTGPAGLASTSRTETAPAGPGEPG